jgi:hypothetical protein
VGNITQELNNLVTIRLPQVNLTDYYYFNHFTIYYRIYLSDIPEPGTVQLSREALNRINANLSSDYFALAPYLSSDNRVNTSSIGSQFRARNYYPLEAGGAEIEQVLGRSGSGNIPAKTLVLDFGTQIPFMRLTWGNNEVLHFLYRSNGASYGGSFIPRPDRYFVNTSELSDPGNVSATTNADVSPKPNMSLGPRYTYASMYIVATGLDPVNYSPIYSAPAFVGILRLPD